MRFSRRLCPGTSHRHDGRRGVSFEAVGERVSAAMLLRSLVYLSFCLLLVFGCSCNTAATGSCAGIDGVRFAIETLEAQYGKSLDVSLDAIRSLLLVREAPASSHACNPLVRLCTILITHCVTTVEVADKYTSVVNGLEGDDPMILMELVEGIIPELQSHDDEEDVSGAGSSSSSCSSSSTAPGSAITPGRSKGMFSSASVLKSASRTAGGDKRRVNFAEGDVEISTTSPVGKFAAKAISSAAKLPNLAAVAAEMAALDHVRKSGKALVSGGSGVSACDDSVTSVDGGRGTTVEALLREEVEDLRDALSAAKREIAVLKNTAANSVSNGSEMMLSRASLSVADSASLLARMEAEMEARKNASENEAALKQQLKDSEANAKALSAKITKLSQELDGLKGLKEEVDVLRPQAAARERAEANVEKLKKKVSQRR
jgi:hypothetical protein